MENTDHMPRLSIEKIAILSIDQLLEHADEVEQIFLATKTLKDRINEAIVLRMSIKNSGEY